MSKTAINIKIQITLALFYLRQTVILLLEITTHRLHFAFKLFKLGQHLHQALAVEQALDLNKALFQFALRHCMDRGCQQ